MPYRVCLHLLSFPASQLSFSLLLLSPCFLIYLLHCCPGFPLHHQGLLYYLACLPAFILHLLPPSEYSTLPSSLSPSSCSVYGLALLHLHRISSTFHTFNFSLVPCLISSLFLPPPLIAHHTPLLPPCFFTNPQPTLVQLVGSFKYLLGRSPLRSFIFFHHLSIHGSKALVLRSFVKCSFMTSASSQLLLHSANNLVCIFKRIGQVFGRS